MLAPGDSPSGSRPPGAEKHPAYRGPASLGTVFALAEPDVTPIERPTRTCLAWNGPDWAEIDYETGEVIATGSVRA